MEKSKSRLVVAAVFVFALASCALPGVSPKASNTPPDDSIGGGSITASLEPSSIEISSAFSDHESSASISLPDDSSIPPFDISSSLPPVDTSSSIGGSSSSLPPSSSSSSNSSSSSSSVPSHEHTFSSEWAYDAQYHWHESTCGHDVTSPKEPHVFEDEVIAPDFDNGGYTIHRCRNCGYSYTDSVTEHLEHTYSNEWSIDDETGTHYHACTDDGFEHLRNDEALHEYGEWTIDQAATTEAEGSKHRTCSICGHVETETIQAIQSTVYLAPLHFAISGDEGYFVTECDSDASGALIIPSVVNGINVVGLSRYAFAFCEFITSVSLPSSIVTIGDSAFCRCDSLESITIPASVGSIGHDAFFGCGSLESVTFSGPVESIGNRAFGDCTSLESVTIPASVESIGSHAFYGCASLASINVDPGNANYSSAGGVLLSGDGKDLIVCPGGKAGDFVVPASVEYIGSFAFWGCSSLESVTIPASVGSIGDYVFYDCSSLGSVTIPASVERIGDNIFRGCASLGSVTFNGTMDEWELVKKSSEWNKGSSISVIHCSDGDVHLD